MNQIIFVFFLLICLSSVKSFCPSKCKCDDKNFRVICLNANFDVVPIMLNPNIKELYLNNNQIKKIPNLSVVYNDLEILDLSGNQIARLDERSFEGLSKLKVIKLNNNRINVLSQNSFFGLNALEQLLLNNNEINSLPADLFHHLNNLKRLYLNNNRLQHLARNQFLDQTNLIDLNLSNNNLSFKNNKNDFLNGDYLINLINLNLSGNLIGNITTNNSPFVKTSSSSEALTNEENNQPFAAHLTNQATSDLNLNNHYTVYNKLFLNNHQLRRLPLFQTWSKKALHLPTAERRTNFKRWTNLKELDLSNCLIHQIEAGSFETLDQLNVLRIKNNNLNDVQSFVFKDLNQLKLLDLSSNLIEQLNKDSFLNLKQLESLNISDSRYLQNIDENAFTDLIKLQFLDLSHNMQLTELNTQLFQPLTSLKQLYLSDNGLTTLDSSILNYASSLEVLDVRNNPFYCDCQIKWLANILHVYANQTVFQNSNLPSLFAEQQKLRLELSQVVCSTPIHLNGKFLYNLTNDQLNCVDFKPFVFIFTGVFVGLLIVLTIVLSAIICARYASGKWCLTFNSSIKQPFTTYETNLQHAQQKIYKNSTISNDTSSTSSAQKTIQRLLGTGNLYQSKKLFTSNNKPEFTWLPATTKPRTNKNHLVFNSLNKTNTICSSIINNYAAPPRDCTIITGLNHGYEVVKEHQLNEPIIDGSNSICDSNSSYLHHNYASLYDTMSTKNELLLHNNSVHNLARSNIQSANLSTKSTNSLNPTNPMHYSYLQTWNPSFDEKIAPIINNSTPISAI